jgi:hypothetical protein
MDLLVYGLCNDISSPSYIAPNGGMNRKLEIIVASFDAISRYSSGRTEENHKETSVRVIGVPAEI